MRENSPCMGCTDKICPSSESNGCRPTCEKFAAWKAKQQEEKEKADSARRKERGLREYYISLSKTIRKGDHK